MSLLAVAALAGQTQWAAPRSIKVTFKETGAQISSKTYTISRQGKNVRVDGTFAVYGAFAKTPHSEIQNETGSYLYVPELKGALKQAAAIASDRLDASEPVDFSKDVFELPKSMLEKQLKCPARYDGDEAIAGRDCFILTTYDPQSNIFQEKQWIDKRYGITLKYQRIEAGKVMFERLATEAAFDVAIEPATFAYPADSTLLVVGQISTAAFEKLRALADTEKLNADLRDVVEKQSKRGIGLSWVSTLTPSAGFGYANTMYRSPTQALPGSRLNNSSSTDTQNLPTRTRRARRNRNGNEEDVVQFVVAGEDAAQEGQTFQVAVTSSVATDGEGVATDVPVRIEFTPEDLQNLRNGDPRQSAEVMRRVQERRAQAQANKPGEGMVISEFINEGNGATLQFYQSKETDPTPSIGSKNQLGAGEAATVNGLKGTFYHATSPFDRNILVWKSGMSWFAFSATGVAKDDLIKMAQTVAFLPRTK